MARLLFVLGSVAAFGCLAGAPADKPGLLAHGSGAYQLPGTETFDVTSHRGSSYRIFVWVPAQAAPANGYPVLVVLDANAYFAAAVSALQIMAPANPALQMSTSLQPMMIVGVGYPGDGTFFLGRRAFDYLPARTSTNPDPRLPREGAPGYPPGGANLFLDFLLDELRPALARRYRVDPDRQSLMGHSLGGFFALYALVKKPDAFRHYVAISPSLWWDDHQLVTEASKAEPLTAQRTTHQVLVAVARDELPDHPDRSEMMRTLSRTMVTNLQRMGANRVAARYLELAGEDHATMQIAVMPAALRTVSQ